MRGAGSAVRVLLIFIGLVIAILVVLAALNWLGLNINLGIPKIAEFFNQFTKRGVPGG